MASFTVKCFQLAFWQLLTTNTAVKTLRFFESTLANSNFLFSPYLRLVSTQESEDIEDEDQSEHGNAGADGSQSRRS